MLQRLGAVALSTLALHGCGAREPAATPPARALPPMAGGASCALQGRAMTRGGDYLFAAREGGEAVAVLTGREVALDITQIASGRERRLRATVEAGGVVVRGWLDLDAVPLYAQRDVPIAPGHIWIREGARVRVIAGQEDRLRVEAAYNDFTNLAVDVDCDAAGLGSPPGAQGEPAPAGPYAHLKGDAATLFPEPGGNALIALRSRREGPTVRVLESRSGMRRVTYDHGVRISGWVREVDLAPGEGPDCDHCYGGDIPDIWDVCPDEPQEGFEDVDGCPEPETPPLHVSPGTNAAIRLRPSRDAEPIGHVVRGGEIFIVEQRDGWGRVHAKGYAVAAPDGHAFWVELAELGGSP